MILNEQYSFSDVRYLISSKIGQRMPVRDPDGKRVLDGPPAMQQLSYDVELAFIGYPQKTLLERGTPLLRLDYPISFARFMNVWWMRREVLTSILREADADSTALRREWQHATAMPKPGKGIRTQILEVVLTQPVYAWVGKASPLFHRRGGAEQIYLPNLAKGAGPNQSDFARVLNTYTLPAA